jgi:hypothetical protein
MITKTAPWDKKKVYSGKPQSTRLCMNCGGVCVCLPIVGVACLKCGGARFITVPDGDIRIWRAEIVKAVRYAGTPLKFYEK